MPWSGGALFLPGIQWQKRAGTDLVGELIAWHLWCDVRGRGNEQRQIHNNIRSLSLARAVGYQTPGWNDVGTIRWLQIWRHFAGRSAVSAMLREQGLDKSSKYADALR